MALIDGAAMVTLVMLLLAFTVSGVLVIAGWNERRVVLQRQGQRAAVGRFELGQTPFEAGTLDVAAEAREVLHSFEGRAAQLLVALDIAVQPGLVVRADRRAFREILSDLLTHAIEQAPCGRVLLGAARSGGRVQISVVDDGPVADRTLRASQLRSAQRLAALQGATMEIRARAGSGTTTVLRLSVLENGRRVA